MKSEGETLRLTTLIVLGFLLCSCSASSPHTTRDAGSDADGPNDASDDSGGDADLAHDADSDADQDVDDPGDAEIEPPIPADRGGVIVLSEYQPETGVHESSASVRFFFQRHPSWCGYGLEMYGDCYVFRYNVPTCEPDCAEEERCTWNEVCSEAACVTRPDPARYFDADDVWIHGAESQEEVICALEDGAYVCDLDESADFFGPDDILSAAAPGRSFPYFLLTVVAPFDLVVVTDTSSWTMETFDGSSDVRIDWYPASPADAIEISVSSADVSMGCLAIDDGRFDIPAAALAAIGEAEDLTVSVIRSNAGIVNESEDGQVKMYAESVGLRLTLD